MTSQFEGKTAVVTGAAGGMGLAAALGLLAGGARVALIDVKPAPPDIARHGAQARFLQADISDDAAVARAMNEAFALGGRLDHLVNAAGVLWFGRDRSLTDLDLDVWRRVFDINLTGAMLAARHAIPLMRRTGGGAMVHISTIQCLRGDDRPQDAYQASKAGLIAMSKSIAIQFAADKIRSNVVLPGPTESPMQDRWLKDPALKQATAKAVPLGRVGRPEDIADAVLFLLSDKASYITGTELVVDGGLMARP